MHGKTLKCIVKREPHPQEAVLDKIIPNQLRWLGHFQWSWKSVPTRRAGIIDDHTQRLGMKLNKHSLKQ